MIGIYKIENKLNNKCYYGSSKNIEKRWRHHQNKLKRGTHINVLLQRAWNKYGEENFIFSVIEECGEDELFRKEQKYLDLQPAYNIGKTASGGDNLSNNPNRTKIIKKISNSVMRRIDSMTELDKKIKFAKFKNKNPNWRGGSSKKYCKCGNEIAPINKTCSKCRCKKNENNPFFGKTHTDDTKRIMRKLRLGKQPSNVRKVKIENEVYESIADASRKTGISSATICWRIRSKNLKFEKYKYL